jgi:hypothetical protein
MEDQAMSDESKKTLYIACDFDGTLTGNGDSWPEIGPENPYAIDVIKRLKRDGHHIILHTCRQGKYLNDAIEWMKDRGVAPDSVNENPHSKELYGPQGPKMFADYYLDDHSLGIKKTKTGSVDFKYIKRNYKKLFV